MPKKATSKSAPKKASPKASPKKASPAKAKIESPKRIASPKAAVSKTTKQKKEAAPQKKTTLTPKSSKFKQLQRLIEDAAENSAEKRSVRSSKERKRSTMLKSKDFLYFDTKRRAARSTEILEDELSE
eukprot:CAMPEP_0168566438 /NCGR_PEP_ID=MMETSP0413-20121227/14419_1 /TAXON_ID=136452 /ORGANISM="Filamoeba nolandi, Strain NC-AS-23-1" /LENGTH=127 /DNA_ID=CAMNT_0008598457 /DNA_START=22 /DNA_END=405 /DNA_ORIENTATION=-